MARATPRLHEETAGDVIAPIKQLGEPAILIGNSMAAGAGVLVAAERHELIRGLVLIGPFVRNGQTSRLQRLGMRTAMARPWAAMTWKAYLPKLYAGQRPEDFDQYRDQLAASLRRPGYAKAFSLTTRTDHTPAEITTTAVLQFLRTALTAQ
jgi:pimeloyl-ACP methyl ester carboxylesterase